MSGAGGGNSILSKSTGLEDDDGSTDSLDSEDDDETIARIQRAHFAQTAAMNARKRAAPRQRPMSQKRKMEAVKNFHDFTKKLKKDTGITIRSLVGNNILELSDFSSEESKSDSDGLSEEEFTVNPNAVQELEEDNESYIDPFTGDIVQGSSKKQDVPPSVSPVPVQAVPAPASVAPPAPTQAVSPPKVKLPAKLKSPTPPPVEEPKTLSISDIINEGDLDLTKNVEIAEVEGSELCTEKEAAELLDIKQEEGQDSQDFDITEKLKEMGEISVKPVSKNEGEEGENPEGEEKKEETDEEKKASNPNALNVRRNIREVMDEKNLDASTLAAQRQESERLARVQEQQRIIREVQRQIAINRQNKIHQKTLSLLQGGSSLLKKSVPGQKLNLPNTVLVKLPSGETKKTSMKQGQVEVTKVAKPTTSGSALKRPDQKTDKKEVVEIVDSSSGEESSSSSSDSDDCIMLSDSEVPPSPEADEDPNNSGLHVNDAYNIPDEQGRVMINIGHPENEEDIFVAPQIARIIKPHQIGGVRFLFDNIIESVERFSTSTGFGCILAHSMGLGKTLQIVCFCDIFLRHTSSKTVLCIMPINTLQNWVAEFNMWLPLDATNSPLAAHGEVRPRNFPIYVLNDSHKTLQMRAKVVKDWTTTGGVLMIGYELYRLLSMKKDKKPRKKKKDTKAEAEKEKEKEEKKNDKPDIGNEDTQSSDITNQTKASEESKDDGDSKIDDGNTDGKKEEKKEDSPTDEDKKLLDEMYEALVRPGPDLVICDEGHRIKNSHSNISYALKQMRTKRRVVLTGYPLQNNLLEYWCMVDFVRPNYLGSKTEFCNMFERPIQNGQCIDSTPQDIRLMRYRAHVLHSLLVGFVQRRSHAVLQSTLPQKEEYVLLVRMTPLQRKLYDRFMNEVVRSTSVPNPLKAFAICCKIWNHPDVLYNFLRKRSEVNAAIEEDLDLEELGGVTKSGRAKNKAPPGRRAAKPRGSSKKPAATIQPNTTGPMATRQDPAYGNVPYPPNGPYGAPPNAFRPDQPGGSYPPYPNYQNPGSGYYPPNQGYNQNYDGNYYPQQPPYGNNYPNQYPANNPDQQGYNQNYWGNGNYYGNSGYYNNPQYPNNQQPQDFRGNSAPDFNNTQQYPPNYNASQHDQSYPGNAMQPYQNNQEGYSAQQRPPYQGYNQPGYPDYNAQHSNATPGTFPPNQNPQEYPNQQYPPSFNSNTPYGPTNPAPYNQFENQPPNYPGYPNNMPPNQMNNMVKSETSFDGNEAKPEPNMSQNAANAAPFHSQNPAAAASFPSQNPAGAAPFSSQNPPGGAPFPDQNFGFQSNASTAGFQPGQNEGSNGSFPPQYPFPPHLETKPPLGSASSGSPVTSWPITELKTEVDKLKAEDKQEIKSESDGEVKIEDLDTKKIVKDEVKKVIQESPLAKEVLPEAPKKKDAKADGVKSDGTETEEEVPVKGRKPRGKGKESKKAEKPKPRGRKPKGRKDRKTSKEKNNDDSDSEESEKEEKPSREEELAIVKKAEEMTYDWAAELLKDYIPGLIENSAKMELFFYILTESIKMGDRILLFSQSLFTLNLIEDFLERNYIPGTNTLWERNTSYYRLDGSTHALEREKLINEFNANPHVYLFLVSTRAGSLGINLVGANRVIVFDASWNPCHDTQAVCRVYRYGQRKPCFVYRFVMDWCLEKKIYDRQINKQGMADRVVDECNPDAVLSMKEITNLCFDNDEKESEAKDLTEYKDKYLDVLMQGIITQHWKSLSKEPFQHESLLVDRKEKKLSSAEKRLAQRGYELEKKAALAPKPTTAYRTVRTADGSLVQRPVASVRPMQHGARWIPADVWRRQGMSAQEMTLPLDVVIPTNSAEKTNIVLKAGQRVMVLKSPKGIYMQLESGKIIAIKTSFKGMGQKGADGKDNSPIGKKVLGSRPSSTNIPGSLKNNSAITITSKGGPRQGSYQRVLSRPGMGGSKMVRPMLPGQKIAEIRNRLGELRSYPSMRPRSPLHQPGRLMRPNLPGSVSITKIQKDTKRSDTDNSDSNAANKMDIESEDDTQVLDSDEEETPSRPISRPPSNALPQSKESENKDGNKEDSKSSADKEQPTNDTETKPEPTKPLVLTTDEKLPTEEALEFKSNDDNAAEISRQERRLPKQDQPLPPTDRLPQQDQLPPPPEQLMPQQEQLMPQQEQLLPQQEQLLPQQDHLSQQPDLQHQPPMMEPMDLQTTEPVERKINLLKNYRHQRPGSRPQTESSLTQLERTASTLSKESMPDFRRNLDDITQSYSPSNEERPGTKSKKKKSPNKEVTESQINDRPAPSSGMSHSVSSLLGSTSNNVQKPRKPDQSPVPVAPIENPAVGTQRLMNRPPMGMSPEASMSPMPGMSYPHGGHMLPGKPQPLPTGMVHGEPGKTPPSMPGMPQPQPPMAPGQPYPAPGNAPPDAPYGQYPGYGMGYGAYGNPAYYGHGYPGYGYGYGAGGAGGAAYGGPPAPDPYLPPNPQW